MKLRFILTAAAAAAVGCGGGEASLDTLYSGVWAGYLGEDTFVFQFNADDQASAGVIHCIRDGLKYSELPISEVTWNPPALEARMDATGVVYSGTVGVNRITGELTSSVSPPIPLDLLLTNPEEISGLMALECEYTYSTPADLDDGLATGSCETHEITADMLEGIVDRIAAGEAGLIHSLLVAADGELVLEQYFHGYTAEDLHRTMSVTKSVSSLLTGIAVDRGLIPGVEEPICSYIPGFRQDIILKHLLTMSMGIGWTDEEAEKTHLTGEDFFGEISVRSASADPGTGFRYVNPDVNLLSGVIHSSTGLYPDQFAEQYLFQPLGIEEYDWSYGADRGHLLMDGSLHLRPRDMMKIGQLVLNRGSWSGTRVISEEWLNESFEPGWRVDDVFSYGYLWWLSEVNGSPVILASGWGSQFIAVIPDARLVIVTTGGNDDNGMNWRILRLLEETLIQSRTGGSATEGNSPGV